VPYGVTEKTAKTGKHSAVWRHGALVTHGDTETLAPTARYDAQHGSADPPTPASAIV
jgi:hypothetical protein